MASKPKTGGPKKPPEPKMTPAEQSERFIKTAQELGVDETGTEFDRALRRVLSKRSNPSGS